MDALATACHWKKVIREHNNDVAKKTESFFACLRLGMWRRFRRRNCMNLRRLMNGFVRAFFVYLLNAYFEAFNNINIIYLYQSLK